MESSVVALSDTFLSSLYVRVSSMVAESARGFPTFVAIISLIVAVSEIL